MIKYISAPCGAGKGLWMNEQIKMNRGKKYIFVQETKQLLEQSYQGLSRYPDGDFIKKRILVSGMGTKNLLESIIHELSTETEVLFITDKMFFQIPTEKLSNHTIFIDDCQASFDIEISGVREKDCEQLIKTYDNIFTNRKEFIPGYSTYDLVGKDVLSDDTNEIVKKYRKFEMYHHKVVCDDIFNGDSRQLAVIGWYDYTKYVDLNVTVLMNAFERSLVYKMTPDIFEPVDNFVPVPTFNLNNLSRLHIRYFSKGEGRHGLTSKKLYGEEMFKVNQALRDILGNDYIWATNERSSLSLPGIKLAANQRGINTYKDYTQFVFMFACNPHPQAVKHMSALFNLSGDDWMEEKELELLNQFAFRTALRKYNDEKVIGYVYDIEQARYFEKLGASIEYIDVGINKPVNPLKSGIPAKERNKFKIWKSKAKGDYSKFERWAALQIRKGSKPEWIDEFRNSL